MTRVLKLLFSLFVLAAVCAPAVSHAATIQKSLDVNWTRQIAAQPGGFVDSTFARAIGSATPTVHDTTSWIDISQFVMPDKGAGNLPTASDSLAWLRFDFYPATSSPTAGADTIYATIQVSVDGVRAATSATPTWVFDTTADGALGALVLEQGTSNQFFWLLRQRIGAVASGDLFFPLRSSTTAPTYQQLYGWPYMRFIVQSDRTGRYDATVTGFVPLK